MKNIILISVILLALIPVSDASSWTLEIFGNANLDDTIDEADVSYVEGILAGNNNSTDFADANHDGLVDDKDIEQIRSIMIRHKTVIEYEPNSEIANRFRVLAQSIFYNCERVVPEPLSDDELDKINEDIDALLKEREPDVM